MRVYIMLCNWISSEVYCAVTGPGTPSDTEYLGSLVSTHGPPHFTICTTIYRNTSDYLYRSAIPVLSLRNCTVLEG